LFVGQTKYTYESSDPRLLGWATKETETATKTADISRAAYTFHVSDVCYSVKPRARYKPMPRISLRIKLDSNDTWLGESINKLKKERIS